MDVPASRVMPAGGEHEGRIDGDCGLLPDEASIALECRVPSDGEFLGRVPGSGRETRTRGAVGATAAPPNSASKVTSLLDFFLVSSLLRRTISDVS